MPSVIGLVFTAGYLLDDPTLEMFLYPRYRAGVYRLMGMSPDADIGWFLCPRYRGDYSFIAFLDFSAPKL